MKLLRGATVALLIGLLLFVPRPASCAPAHATATLDTDRWLEIDLYWFKQQQQTESVRAFWDRFQPLFAGVRGYRGVILNIGWTVGPVMEWSGNLAQKISLPTGSGQSRWVDERGPLAGTTEERKRESKARFAGALVSQRHGYDPWTYGDLRRLAAALQAGGGTSRHGFGFKVGMLNYAWTNAYGEEGYGLGWPASGGLYKDHPSRTETTIRPGPLLRSRGAPPRRSNSVGRIAPWHSRGNTGT